MSNFDKTSVNETDDTANVGAGVLLGDLALALNEYGRALPHGRCPTVGYVPPFLCDFIVPVNDRTQSWRPRE